MAFKDDQFYIEKILAGDTAAFEPLVEKHKDFVFTIVVRILHIREEAEETAQDVFLKAFQSLKNYRAKSKFSTWLYSIAYNTAISKTRKRKLPTADLSDEMIQNYSEDEFGGLLFELSPEEQQQRLSKAMETLNDEENVLITLYYKNDSSIEEISEITALSMSNVKVKLHRIRKKLYTKLSLIDEIIAQKHC
jgi:RNA polymerase sigma-70 factor, ECF subfamily